MTPEDIEEMRKDTKNAMVFVRVPPALMLEILDLANAELSRLRSSPDPVIRDPDDDDWDAFGFQGTKAEFLRIWNRALSRSPAPVVGGVPELADSEVDKILSQRDEWEERATDLAENVGTFLGVDVGEHSSANCPIASAMEALDEAIFAASRLPALKPGEVVVQSEYLAMLESAANRFCSSCRDIEGCTMTTRHLGGLGCGAWKLDGARINALRAQATPTEKETDHG